MEFYTVQEWEENFDQLFARVEGGETIGIIDGDYRAMMMPYTERSLSNLVNAPNS
jgi:hypothetical protein